MAAPPPRLLFVDFDGVLNTSGHWAMLPATRTSTDVMNDALSFERALVESLNALCRTARASVVVSSSWRWRYPDPSLEGLTALLERHGFEGMVVGAIGTGDHGTGRDIEAWLAALGIPARYAVLDDSTLGEATLQTLGRHVRPDMRVGLSSADAERVVDILERAQPVRFSA